MIVSFDNSTSEDRLVILNNVFTQVTIAINNKKTVLSNEPTIDLFGILKFKIMFVCRRKKQLSFIYLTKMIL